MNLYFTFAVNQIKCLYSVLRLRVMSRNRRNVDQCKFHIVLSLIQPNYFTKKKLTVASHTIKTNFKNLLLRILHARSSGIDKKPIPYNQKGRSFVVYDFIRTEWQYTAYFHIHIENTNSRDQNGTRQALQSQAELVLRAFTFPHKLLLCIILFYARCEHDEFSLSTDHAFGKSALSEKVISLNVYFQRWFYLFCEYIFVSHQELLQGFHVTI